MWRLARRLRIRSREWLTALELAITRASLLPRVFLGDRSPREFTMRALDR